MENRGLTKRTDQAILVWSVRARSPGPRTNRVYKALAFTNFCQAFFRKKLHKHFPRTLCILYIDFFLKVWYTINVKRRETKARDTKMGAHK